MLQQSLDELLYGLRGVWREAERFELCETQLAHFRGLISCQIAQLLVQDDSSIARSAILTVSAAVL